MMSRSSIFLAGTLVYGANFSLNQKDNAESPAAFVEEGDESQFPAALPPPDEMMTEDDDEGMRHRLMFPKLTEGGDEDDIPKSSTIKADKIKAKANKIKGPPNGKLTKALSKKQGKKAMKAVKRAEKKAVQPAKHVDTSKPKPPSVAGAIKKAIGGSKHSGYDWDSGIKHWQAQIQLAKDHLMHLRYKKGDKKAHWAVDKHIISWKIQNIRRIALLKIRDARTRKLSWMEVEMTFVLRLAAFAYKELFGKDAPAGKFKKEFPLAFEIHTGKLAEGLVKDEQQLLGQLGKQGPAPTTGGSKKPAAKKAVKKAKKAAKKANKVVKKAAKKAKKAVQKAVSKAKAAKKKIKKAGTKAAKKIIKAAKKAAAQKK